MWTSLPLVSVSYWPSCASSETSHSHLDWKMAHFYHIPQYHYQRMCSHHYKHHRLESSSARSVTLPLIIGR
nr:MAG TPA: hypothetical protein [Caudoviricetes sp.]